MTPDEFFDHCPDAPGVWVAGRALFLHHAKAEAQQYARTAGVDLIYMDRETPPTPEWLRGLQAGWHDGSPSEAQ